MSQIPFLRGESPALRMALAASLPNSRFFRRALTALPLAHSPIRFLLHVRPVKTRITGSRIAEVQVRGQGVCPNWSPVPEVAGSFNNG
jgi:hypothetical protein